ncbi:unnamed protein product [Staurois parvus]|uniref:Uncharacterized protein n=1 Tax=Staurois parvus TaxID=386267 RepID=A0ABN9D9D9_9NEOB|nr:unnamed protein product [Staurois parvus]
MYVKWFDTAMFYYVILGNLVNVTLSFSNFPPFRARTSRCRRGRNPEDRCQHPPEDNTWDTAGETWREHRTR